VLFAPIGFRMNLTLQSKRLEKFDNGIYPPIASLIALPKNIFEGVIFHSEILIFNIKGLKSHYFYKPNEPTNL
jgi:type I restriction enzyme M protein